MGETDGSKKRQGGKSDHPAAIIHPGNPDAGNQESKDHPKLPDGGRPLLLEERMVGDSPVAVSETPRGETEATEKDEKDDEEEEKKGKKKEKKPAVPYWRLFSYADRTDVALMAVGTLGAVLHGAALPISFLFLGKMVDSFGTNDLSGVNTVRGVREGRDDGEGVRRAAKCEGAPAVPAGAAAAGGAVWTLVFHSSPPLPTPPFLLPLSSFAEVACLMHTGERQSARVRWLYLQALLLHPERWGGGVLDAHGREAEREGAPAVPATHISPSSHLLLCPPLPLPSPQRWRAGCTRARGRARGCAGCTCNSHFPLFPSPPLSSASPAIPAEVACWMHTGERQSARVRRLYLQALLRQEVAFFDLEACSGELVNRVSSDVLLLQDAISEKVGNCIHYFSTFVCGFIVGFTSVWQLALVILAVCPLIIATGGIYAAVLTGLMTQGEKAYSEAGKIAEQAVGQVPPVQSYGAEDRTAEAYGRSPNEPLTTPSSPFLFLPLPIPPPPPQAVLQVRTVQSYVAEDRTVEACGLPHRLATHNLPHHPLFTTPSPPSPPPHQAVGQVRTVQSYVAEDRTVEACGLPHRLATHNLPHHPLFTTPSPPSPPPHRILSSHDVPPR
ncbi:unnamed protein product [Closterium sp. Naga37s-1]|nr:unnamed protein product [Closterium sp. Naga37s-1]